MKNDNYNVASAGTVSNERGVKLQWIRSLMATRDADREN